LNNQSSEKEYLNRKREENNSKKFKSAINNSKLSKKKIG